MKREVKELEIAMIFSPKDHRGEYCGEVTLSYDPHLQALNLKAPIPIKHFWKFLDDASINWYESEKIKVWVDRIDVQFINSQIQKPNLFKRIIDNIKKYSEEMAYFRNKYYNHDK